MKIRDNALFPLVEGYMHAMAGALLLTGVSAFAAVLHMQLFCGVVGTE